MIFVFLNAHHVSPASRVELAVPVHWLSAAPWVRTGLFRKREKFESLQGEMNTVIRSLTVWASTKGGHWHLHVFFAAWWSGQGVWKTLNRTDSLPD